MPHTLLSPPNPPSPPAPHLQDPWGRPAHGWAGQAAILSRKYANVSLADRVPQAMWRGRTQDAMYPQRDALRWGGMRGRLGANWGGSLGAVSQRRQGQGQPCGERARLRSARPGAVPHMRLHLLPPPRLLPPHVAPPCPAPRRKFVACVPELERAGRAADAALISVLRPPVALQDSCDYRWGRWLGRGGAGLAGAGWGRAGGAEALLSSAAGHAWLVAALPGPF